MHRVLRSGMKIPIAHLNELAVSAPKYHADLVRKGRVQGDFPFIGPDQEREKLPSIATQAKNVIGAVRQAVMNPTPVSKEERKRRLSICHSCEFLIDEKRCAKCGCTVKWKALLEAWHCPISRW